MSDDKQINALERAANDLWGNDALSTPKSTSWGMYSYGDAPAAIGGGVGAFTWFDSRSALLKFVTEALPFSPPGPHDSDPLAVADKVKSLVTQIRAGDLDLESARRKLNTVLRAYSQIEWIGTFKDLKDGNGAYAKRIIKEFRESQALPVGKAPVAVSRTQLKDFKEFLASYGY